MRKLNNAISRFCYRHPRFGIPHLMAVVTAANVVVWLLMVMDTTGTLATAFYFNPGRVLQGQIWRLVTFPFVPDTSSPIFMILALYFYYFQGTALERHWGSGPFTIFYLGGMLATVAVGFVLYAFGYNASYSGTYLNLSLIFAFAALYPDTVFLICFILPVKAKWLALLDAVVYAFAVVTLPFPLKLIPLAAVANVLVFCGEDLLAMIRPYRKVHSRSSVNFRKEAARIRREQKHQNYTRKCEVCGRTDTDYPDLEFRYCSQCQGYHCFCQDHINNHQHRDK